MQSQESQGNHERTVVEVGAKVAVLGLGAMGSRMANRLLDAGYDVCVYNRSAAAAEPLVAKGATRAETPRAAAEGRDAVLVCVRDDEAARSVWLEAEHGALAGMRAGAIGVESSTLTPGCAAELAAAAKARGVEFLDAPVVGTRPQAESGQLVHLVGGAEASVARVRPLLAVLGGAAHHLGPVGAGAILKLVVNSLFALQVLGVAELLGLAERAGLERAATLEVLGALPITSPAAKGAGALILAGRHAPMFPIELVAKDLRYAEALAADVASELPSVAAARATYEAAAGAGFGELNITGVARIFGG